MKFAQFEAYGLEFIKDIDSDFGLVPEIASYWTLGSKATGLDVLRFEEFCQFGLVLFLHQPLEN